MAGILVFTLASAGCGVAPTLPLLIAARAAQGLGAAIVMAVTMALVGATVPRERTGSAMGLPGTMSAIGTGLGPALGGVLIAGPGWRASFLINVPLGILALLLALTLAAYALAMTIGRGRSGPINAALMLAAVLGVGLFILAEAKAASPLLRLAMSRSPVLSSGLATSALVSPVVMTTLVVGPSLSRPAMRCSRRPTTPRSCPMSTRIGGA